MFPVSRSGDVIIPKATIHRDSKKIRKETIKRYDLIDGSNREKVRSVQNFQICHYAQVYHFTNNSVIA